MKVIKKFLEIHQSFGIKFAVKKAVRAVLFANLSRIRRLAWALPTRGITDQDLFYAHAKNVDQIWGQPRDFVVGQISKGLIKELEEKFCSVSSFVRSESRFAYQTHPVLAVTRYDENTLKNVGKNIIPGNMHEFDYSNKTVKLLHDELRQIFDRHVGSPFIFVNTRIWKTKANSNRYNSNDWHKDGFMPGHLKIMIYLTPLNEEYGTFSWRDSNGNEQTLDGLPVGTAVCFRNSDIEHSGVPGKTHDRISIEVTLMRSLVDGQQTWPGHFWGRHFKTPRQVHLIAKQRIDTVKTFVQPLKNQLPDFSDKLKINIGSGVRHWAGWVCLDELNAPNVTRTTFDSNTVFPVAEETVSLFYSSHFFEHVSDEVIWRILDQMKKCAAPGAYFVLKIPDYSWFLEQYNHNVEECMKDKGLEDFIWSWPAKNIEDNFKNRLIYMFCGYWNSNYGDHFSGNINRNNKAAFHGPTKLSDEQIDAILSSNSPAKIARDLFNYSQKNIDLKSFNHRSAWSRGEIVELLSKFEIEVLHDDADVICNQFRDIIPDISQMQSWSAYYLCRLPRKNRSKKFNETKHKSLSD